MCIVLRKYYAILNFVNVYFLHLKYIIVIYVDSENNILSYQAMMLQEAHMYFEDGLYHIHPLHENQLF